MGTDQPIAGQNLVFMSDISELSIEESASLDPCLHIPVMQFYKTENTQNTLKDLRIFSQKPKNHQPKDGHFPTLGVDSSSDLTSPITGTTPITPLDGLSANLLKEQLYKKKSRWVPPRGPPTFEAFAMLNVLDLNNAPIRAPGYPNLDLDAEKVPTLSSTRLFNGDQTGY